MPDCLCGSSYQVSLSGGPVVVAERGNEDMKKTRVDWADGAARQKCELEGTLGIELTI